MAKMTEHRTLIRKLRQQYNMQPPEIGKLLDQTIANEFPNWKLTRDGCVPDLVCSQCGWVVFRQVIVEDTRMIGKICCANRHEAFTILRSEWDASQAGRKGRGQ